MLPPENANAVSPASGAKVGVPQPTVEAPGAGATTMAAGDVAKGMVNETPAIADGLGLVMRKLKVELVPAVTVPGANDAAKPTSPGVTT